ncbi:MupA/Atu3671 family FMN-dependent luciferase-like monooxygenase [Streptomyces sp. NPDC127084]|uniref:MupA/Atu3671 family FMN-dependent luciferase-like monooxygenase n=1 Tax=Streptomyces sp. NPDC127084 TaxID=3347133 RepID=UPI0036606416
MDFSLFYFADDSASHPDGGAGRYELLLEGARFADQHGFRAVWTPERHFHAFGGLYPNPAVVGAALATTTERIAIRAGSVVAPLHHPLRIAEEWSVVDNLSGGRVGVSFASGWHPVDFALSHSSYQDRKRVTLERVEQVRTLWRGGSHEVVDGTGNPAAVRIYPPPVQPELPVWITSAGDADTFRAAATSRAGILTHLLHQDIGELAGKIAEYRRVHRDTHDGAEGHVVLMLHTLLGQDLAEVREAVRGPLHAYLKSSLNLVTGSLGNDRPGSHPDSGSDFESDSDPGDDIDIDADALDEEDIEFLVARSFDTYVEERGLFGTVDEARRIVERLRDVGVDEIACLIDFGVDTATVLKGLRQLDELREAFA